MSPTMRGNGNRDSFEPKRPVQRELRFECDRCNMCPPPGDPFSCPIYSFICREFVNSMFGIGMLESFDGTLRNIYEAISIYNWRYLSTKYPRLYIVTYFKDLHLKITVRVDLRDLIPTPPMHNIQNTKIFTSLRDKTFRLCNASFTPCTVNSCILFLRVRTSGAERPEQERPIQRDMRTRHESVPEDEHKGREQAREKVNTPIPTKSVTPLPQKSSPIVVDSRSNPFHEREVDAGESISLVSTCRMKRRRLEQEESAEKTIETKDKSLTLGSLDTSRDTNCERDSNSTSYESKTQKNKVQDWLNQSPGNGVQNEDGLDRESASPYEPREREGNEEAKWLEDEDHIYFSEFGLI